MASFKFNNVYIKDWKSIVGPLEKESKLKRYDFKMDDYYYGEKTFEQAEIKMQRVVFDELVRTNNNKISDEDVIIGGDLLDQIVATNYAFKNQNVSLLGIYSACASFVESLIIGSTILKDKEKRNIYTITSSHNLTAERQFRYPIEYGSPKPHVVTFTTTGVVSTLLSKDNGKIKIESATIGKVIDKGITDANNLGAVMAPAAADTIYNHLKDLERDISYYDLIVTGDLGCIGTNIFKEYALKCYDLKIKKHIDAGCELYLNSQETYAGGSGPVCLPLVFFNKILSVSKAQKILLVGTGALHNKTMINEKLSIPAIAHAVSLEIL